MLYSVVPATSSSPYLAEMSTKVPGSTLRLSLGPVLLLLIAH